MGGKLRRGMYTDIFKSLITTKYKCTSQKGFKQWIRNNKLRAFSSNNDWYWNMYLNELVKCAPLHPILHNVIFYRLITFSFTLLPKWINCSVNRAEIDKIFSAASPAGNTNGLHIKWSCLCLRPQSQSLAATISFSLRWQSPHAILVTQNKSAHQNKNQKRVCNNVLKWRMLCIDIIYITFIL